MSNVLRLFSRLASRVSRPDYPATLASTSTLALTFTLALGLIASASAEDWGFAFSGQILEVVDGAKSVAKKDGSTDYEATVWIRLYDDSEATKTAKTGALWGRTAKVHVKDGTFSCELKDAMGEVLTAAYTNLQDAISHTLGGTITVGVTPFDDAYAEIDPRQRLSSVPLAVNAGDSLGASGDISIGGTLTTGALKTPSITFDGPVTHYGDVRFSTDPNFPTLVLEDDEKLEAKRVAVHEDISVMTVEADSIKAGESKVLVERAAAAAFENLKVSGKATAANVTSAGETLTVQGDLAANQSLAVTNFVFGGGVELFAWGDIVELAKTTDPGNPTAYYIDGSGNGSWTPPEAQMQGHLLMSLNFNLTAGSALTVCLDDLTVGELKSPTGGWMSIQVIVPVGKKISWSGGPKSSEADDKIEVYYRQFRF